MARHNASDMATPRSAVTKAGPPLPGRVPQAGQGNQMMPSSGPKKVRLPVGGEAHVRALKGGGVLATVRDGNYNTVEETYADDPTSIQFNVANNG